MLPPPQIGRTLEHVFPEGGFETGLPRGSPKTRLGYLMQGGMPEVLTTPEASMPAASARPPGSGAGPTVALVIVTYTRW